MCELLLFKVIILLLISIFFSVSISLSFSLEKFSFCLSFLLIEVKREKLLLFDILKFGELLLLLLLLKKLFWISSLLSVFNILLFSFSKGLPIVNLLKSSISFLPFGWVLSNWKVFEIRLLLLLLKSFVLPKNKPEELEKLLKCLSDDINKEFFLNGVNKGLGYCCRRGRFKEISLGRL